MSSFEEFYRDREADFQHRGGTGSDGELSREIVRKLLQDEVVRDIFRGPMPYFEDLKSSGQDFVDSIEGIVRIKYGPGALHYRRATLLLSDIYDQSLTQLATLNGVVKLVSAFVDRVPSERAWSELEETLLAECSETKNYELILQGISGVFTSIEKTRTAGLTKILALTEQSRRILDGPDVAPAFVPDISIVLAGMAGSQRRFRGIKSIKSLYQGISEGIDHRVITRALSYGLEGGESPKLLVRALGCAKSYLTLKSPVTFALNIALEDQYRNNGSIASLVESFHKILDDSKPREIDSKMAVYCEFLQELRNQRIRVDGIGLEQLDRYEEDSSAPYAAEFAVNMRMLDDCLEQVHDHLRDIGLGDANLLREMTLLLQRDASREAIEAFGEYVQATCEGDTDLRRSWDSFSAIVESRFMTPERWKALCEMISHQRLPLRRDGTELLQTVANVVNRSDPEQSWTRFHDAMARYRDNLSDLRYITPEFVEYYASSTQAIRSGELQRVLQLAEVIYASDANRPIVFRELMSSLLEKEGLTDIFMKAYGSDDLLGIARPKACRAYWDFQALSQAGLEDVVSQMIAYQISEGYPALESIRTVHEVCDKLGVLNQGGAEDNRDLLEYRKLLQVLQRRSLPLEGLTHSIVEFCHDKMEDDSAMKKVEEHLQRAHQLFIRNSGEPYTQLIRTLARYGFQSAGLQVVELLMDEEAGVRISPGRLADKFREPTALGRRGWLSVGRYIELYRDQGLPISALIDWAVAFDRELNSAFLESSIDWELAEELLVDLRDGGFPPYLVTVDFARAYQKASDEVKPLLLVSLRTLTEFSQSLAAQNDEKLLSNLKDSLRELASRDFGLLDNPAMVYKLRLVLLRGDVQNLSGYNTVLRELKMHALTDIMRSSPSKARRNWARVLIGKEFNMGGPPFMEEDPTKQLAYSETMEVVDRAFRESKGFGSVAIDSRGAPRSELLEPAAPFLVRFAMDCMQEVHVVNSSSNAEFPGKGIFMSKLKVGDVFTPDSEWRENGKISPYWRWEQSGGLFSSKYFYHCRVANLANTGFLMMRGLKIVVPPFDRDHLVDGQHYSYLVYNRHFYPGPQTAIGVPTQLIEGELEPALIPASDFVGFSPRYRDSQQIDFTFAGLQAKAKQRGLPLLDLTYGSVIGGGLCNAFPPFSAPYYSWELDAMRAWGWKDSWGHVHKAFLMRYPDDESRLEAFQYLHGEVYNWARLCQDYLTAWQFALSFYKMGTTLAAKDDVRQSQMQAEEQEEGQDQDVVFGDERQMLVHEYRYRMLEEAYRWFRGGREQGWSMNKMPVLHFAYTIDPNSIPSKEKRKFELDTATMVLKIGSEEIQLPQDGDGRGEQEREIWRDFVVPFFENKSTGWEPRFLLRNGAFSLYE